MMSPVGEGYPSQGIKSVTTKDRYFLKLFQQTRGLYFIKDIYRLFNVNKKKWRPMGHFPNQPKMANYESNVCLKRFKLIVWKCE